MDILNTPQFPCVTKGGWSHLAHITTGWCGWLNTGNSECLDVMHTLVNHIGVVRWAGIKEDHYYYLWLYYLYLL